MPKYPICEFLSLAILKTNRTGAQLAREIGVSTNVLAKWKDHTIPPEESLVSIQSALGVDMEELKEVWSQSIQMREKLKRSGLVVRKR